MTLVNIRKLRIFIQTFRRLQHSSQIRTVFCATQISPMSIFSDHVDIREYPPHDWPAKRIKAKVNGKWTYFYANHNNMPLNSAAQYDSPPPLSNPGTPSLRMKRLTSSIPRFVEERHVDSYDLLRRQRSKERAQQSLRLSAICLLDQSRSKTSLLSPAQETAKRERTMQSPLALKIDLPETPMIIQPCQPKGAAEEKHEEPASGERMLDLAFFSKK